jgi:hypothetical protein
VFFRIPEDWQSKKYSNPKYSVFYIFCPPPLLELISSIWRCLLHTLLIVLIWLSKYVNFDQVGFVLPKSFSLSSFVLVTYFPHPRILELSSRRRSASLPGHFTPGEKASGTHWRVSWVGPRTGLDDVERRKILPLPGLELRPLGRPACSQSLYRLRYPGPFQYIDVLNRGATGVGNSTHCAFI